MLIFHLFSFFLVIPRGAVCIDYNELSDICVAGSSHFPVCLPLPRFFQGPLATLFIELLPYFIHSYKHLQCFKWQVFGIHFRHDSLVLFLQKMARHYR